MIERLQIAPLSLPMTISYHSGVDVALTQKKPPMSST